MLLKKISILLTKSTSNTSKHDREIQQQILLDRRNYARISSYCALFVTAISTAIGFVGIILVLKGEITIGALTSIGGFLATNGFEKIAAEANRRIDSTIE
jgi:ABC-type bacteriocin/lantibiotic exporter with double-glycine peptidase domain